jgi:hypothetical protein
MSQDTSDAFYSVKSIHSRVRYGMRTNDLYGLWEKEKYRVLIRELTKKPESL